MSFHVYRPDIHVNWLQVLSAYSSGVLAFKGITKEYGLTPEAVDDVMTDVQEVRVKGSSQIADM